MNPCSGYTGTPLLYLIVVSIHDLPPDMWDREPVQQASATLSTDHWLQEWVSSLPVDGSHTVPLTATIVCASAWHSMLGSHPDKLLV